MMEQKRVWIYRFETRIISNEEVLVIQCLMPDPTSEALPCSAWQCKVSKCGFDRFLIATAIDEQKFKREVQLGMVPKFLNVEPKKIAENYSFYHNVEETPVDFFISKGVSVEGPAYILDCVYDPIQTAKHMSENVHAYGCVVWATRTWQDVAMYMFGCSFADHTIGFIYKWVDLKWDPKFWERMDTKTDFETVRFPTVEYEEALGWMLSKPLGSCKFPVFKICSMDLENAITEDIYTEFGIPERMDYPDHELSCDNIVIIGYVVGLFNNGKLSPWKKHALVYDPRGFLKAKFDNVKSDLTKDVNVKFLKSQYEMVLEYVNDVQDCLVVTGWNINLYDMKFMLSVLLGSESIPPAVYAQLVARFCECCETYQYLSCPTSNSKEMCLFRDAHQIQMDGMKVKMIYMFVKCDNSLEKSAQAILGEGKHDVSFDMMKTLWTKACKKSSTDVVITDENTNFLHECVAYCVKDCDLAGRIVALQMCKLLGMQLCMSLEEMTYTLSSVPYLEISYVFCVVFLPGINCTPIPFERCMYGGRHPFARQIGVYEARKFKGARVISPAKGATVGTIITYDVNSMYPSIMLEYSLVPGLSIPVPCELAEELRRSDSRYDKMFNFTKVEECLNTVLSLKSEYAKAEGVHNSAFTFLNNSLKERDVQKNLLAAEKRKPGGGDPQMIMVLDGMQNGMKLFGNGLYGKQGDSLKKTSKFVSNPDTYYNENDDDDADDNFNDNPVVNSPKKSEDMNDVDLIKKRTAEWKSEMKYNQSFKSRCNVHMFGCLSNINIAAAVTKLGRITNLNIEERICNEKAMRVILGDTDSVSVMTPRILKPVDVNPIAKDLQNFINVDVLKNVLQVKMEDKMTTCITDGGKKRYAILNVFTGEFKSKGDKRVHKTVLAFASEQTKKILTIVTAFKMLRTILQSAEEREYHNVSSKDWRPEDSDTPDTNMVGWLSKKICSKLEFESIKQSPIPLACLTKMVEKWATVECPTTFTAYKEFKSFVIKHIMLYDVVKVTKSVKDISEYVVPPPFALVSYETFGLQENLVSFVKIVPEKREHTFGATSMVRNLLHVIKDDQDADKLVNLKPVFEHLASYTYCVNEINLPHWWKQGLVTFQDVLSHVTMLFKDRYVAANLNAIQSVCDELGVKYMPLYLKDVEPFFVSKLTIIKTLRLWPTCSNDKYTQNTFHSYAEWECKDAQLHVETVQPKLSRDGNTLIYTMAGTEWTACTLGNLLGSQNVKPQPLNQRGRKRKSDELNACIVIGTADVGSAANGRLNLLGVLKIITGRSGRGAGGYESFDAELLKPALNAGNVVFDTPMGFFFYTGEKLKMWTDASKTCKTYLENVLRLKKKRACTSKRQRI